MGGKDFCEKISEGGIRIVGLCLKHGRQSSPNCGKADQEGKGYRPKGKFSVIFPGRA